LVQHWLTLTCCNRDFLPGFLEIHLPAYYVHGFGVSLGVSVRVSVH
jgi:hypothetical protein